MATIREGGTSPSRCHPSSLLFPQEVRLSLKRMNLEIWTSENNYSEPWLVRGFRVPTSKFRRALDEVSRCHTRDCGYRKLLDAGHAVVPLPPAYFTRATATLFHFSCQHFALLVLLFSCFFIKYFFCDGYDTRDSIAESDFHFTKCWLALFYILTSLLNSWIEIQSRELKCR